MSADSSGSNPTSSSSGSMSEDTHREAKIGENKGWRGDGGEEAEGLLPRCCDGGGLRHVMPKHLSVVNNASLMRLFRCF